MRTQIKIKIAVGLVGCLLALTIWMIIWVMILHGLGVSHYAEVYITLLITAVALFAATPRLETLMDELAETAPEWRTVIGWFRKQA